MFRGYFFFKFHLGLKDQRRFVSMPTRVRALSRIEHRLFKSTGIKEIGRDVKPEEWRNKRVPPYCGRVMPDPTSVLSVHAGTLRGA